MSADLHALIHSMSRTEKRYFSVEAGKRDGKTSNYLRLYKVLSNMKHFDEDLLRKKLKGDKVLKHFAQERKYLNDSLLKMLRNYRSDKSAYAQTKERLLDIHYLIERGLYSQAERMLKRLKRHAYRYQDFPALLEIIDEEIRIQRSMRGAGNKQAMEAFIGERDKVVDTIKQKQQLNKLFNRLYFESVANQHNRILKNEKIKKGLPLILQPLDPTTEAGVQLLYLKSNAFYHQFYVDTKKAIPYFQQYLAWWDSNPHIKEEEFSQYIASLSNFFQILLTTHQFEQCKKILEFVSGLEPKSSFAEYLIFKNLTLYKFLYHINVGEFDAAIDLIPTIENGLQKYAFELKATFGMFANIAIMYFILENYQACIHWFNKFPKGTKSDTRIDIQRFMRLLNVLAHYESDSDQLEVSIRAAQRFLTHTSDKVESPFEEEILKRLRKIFKAPLLDLKKELQSLKAFLQQQQNAKMSIGFEELYLWIQKQQTGRSMKSIILEQKKHTPL